MRFLFIIMLLAAFSTEAQTKFDAFFTSKALRYDFLLGGNSTQVVVYPQQIKQLPVFSGSHNELTANYNYGNYRIRLLDQKSGEVIFSKGFSPLFMEWQTTDEAKTQNKCFYQSAIVPFPKEKIKLEIEQRTWGGNFISIHFTEIDPTDHYILKETHLSFEVREIHHSGKPEESVDLVFLAEGYTVSEMDKFVADARRMTDYLFETAPFDGYRDKFNVSAVLAPSMESETDVAGEKIYRNTAFNSGFYTFGTPRYLTTSDMKSVYDALDNVPCDHAFVLVNTDRYGGGGFYNFYGIGSADNSLSEKVFVHEFGHSFAGLGDEYYTSSVAFDNFYNLAIEPWEPNITTMVDFDSKWKNMIDEKTPVPTPRNMIYENTTGVFEGGGYMAKGIFSPMMNCRMKSNEVEYFCPVCREAIKKTIELHIR